MATIADVARHAGVSISTVSYVLSGKRAISAETDARVRRSIRELGYRPHAGARSLAGSRTNVLALVVPLRSDMNLPVLMRFVTTIVLSAREHDHDVLLLTQDEGVDGLLRVAESAMADAFIVMDVEADDPRPAVLTGLAQPSVLIGVPDDPSGLPCVDLDFAAAGAACLEHLAGLGHRCVGFLGPPEQVYLRGTSFARRTLEGFRGAADAHGVRTAEEPCTPTFGGVRAALAALRERRPGLSAVVVHNEDALPVLQEVLHAEGAGVPGDLSLVAIGPDESAEGLPVPMTVVAMPAEQIAKDAVRTVMRRLDGAEDHTVRLLPPQLQLRASTAPPPNAP
ncbi:LacI family DNA-binding transcriptional regulator [Allonocardiopsis opalescens]|uniref:LacI family transcriptional regulator n=1 Tax=Allonocardiopsis opalescens TaxID=1144618 RepID=A0A2T0PXG9_9ACTN|nr:LacI family DNA-binding transcriptional regulator [Allonocardiopsis opalescens]PRX96096.1 LacI family transcriptional regulator [Allonocardiopsis opalescens]